MEPVRTSEPPEAKSKSPGWENKELRKWLAPYNALRNVQISGTKSGVGAGYGAVAGATAGAAAAGGDAAGAALEAIGGAVVGEVAGAVTEEALTKAGAVEFIIKQENGQKIAVVQTNEENLAVGDKILILRSNKVRIVKDNTVGD